MYIYIYEFQILLQAVSFYLFYIIFMIYYSEDSSSLVKQGLKALSKMRNEAPFQCLCQALVNEDVEV